MRITFDGDNFPENEWQNFLAVFKTLTRQEHRQVGLFLASPYFNTDDRAVRLYERILSSHRNNSERINGRSLLRAVFPGQTIDSAKTALRPLLRQLTQLLWQYIKHQEVEDDHLYGGMIQTAAFKKRTDTELFQQAAEQLQETLAAEPVTLMSAHWRWWLYHQLYFHQNTRQYQEEAIGYLQQAIRQMQQCYHLSALRYYGEILNRSHIKGREEPLSAFAEELVSLVTPGHTDPLIALYSKVAKLMQQPVDGAGYQDFKESYRRYPRPMAAPDRLVMIKSACNIWLWLHEAGHEGAAREMFFWVHENVRHGTLLFEGSLSDLEYLNCVIIAGLAGEYSFLESFITDYYPHLEEEHREEARQMALIYQAFFQGDLQKVLKRLQQHFPRYHHAMHIYTLRAKVLYVLTYLQGSLQPGSTGLSVNKCQDEFELELDNFRKYVSRADELDTQRRAPYMRFVRICRRIYDYELGNPDRHTKAGRQAIIEQIEAPEPLLARSILRQMASRLSAG